jgi:hypothetical protein
MEGIWKTLAAPIIGSIIAGLVVGIILGRAQAPEIPVIQAKASWIDVRNPIYDGDLKLYPEAAKFLEQNFGIKHGGELLQSMRWAPEIRVMEITLRNNSAIRSKSIEIAIKDGALFGEGIDPSSSDKLQVEFINPYADVRLTGVVAAWSTYSPSPMLFLHDGKRIDLEETVLPEELHWLVSLILAYPIVSFFAFGTMLILTCYILVALPVVIVADYNPAFKFRLTSKSELKKVAKFISYVRENHPDALE